MFPYHLASYLKMTHTQNPLGNQSESDTSYLDSHISDKQDSNALYLYLYVIVIVIGITVVVIITEGQSWR